MGVDIRDIVSTTKISLESLSGKILAIDAYNALYQFLAIIRGEAGEPLRDSKGKVTSHLSGLFYRNINLLNHGIRPVYILDGKPPSLKAAEIARRRQVKVEATIRYKAAIATREFREARKYAQATSYLEDYMVGDTKKILDLLGIPWIDAPSEGEATAAYLTTTRDADAAASQDFDSLLFGAVRLVRNLTISGRRKLPRRSSYVEVEPEEIEQQEVLNKLGVTKEQLVDLGILVGTDFNPDGFRGIGPSTALKLIKTYGRLEEIPTIQDKLQEIDFKAVRSIFLSPAVVRAEKLEWKPVDKNSLVGFLCNERDFSRDRIISALQKLEVAQSRKSQTLEQWFG